MKRTTVTTVEYFEYGVQEDGKIGWNPSTKTVTTVEEVKDEDPVITGNYFGAYATSGDVAKAVIDHTENSEALNFA